MRSFLIPALLGLAARLSSASALDDWAALSEANTAFFCYDEAGCVVSEPSPRKQDVSGPRLVSKLAPDGSYSLLLNGNGGARSFSIAGLPGETLIPVAEDAAASYFISESGFEGRTLLRMGHDVAAPAVILGCSGGNDLLAPVIDRRDPDNYRVVGGMYLCRDKRLREWMSISSRFDDPAYREADTELRDRFPGASPVWLFQSPLQPDSWIVRMESPEHPSIWAEIDVSSGVIQILARYLGRIPPMRRMPWGFTASDGVWIDGILSAPANGDAFQLVVFPHGGPGDCVRTAFDARVAMLVDSGFAVWQPNYRGSTMHGKRYRLGGWRAEGIRRGLDDIHEGAMKLIRDPSLPIASDRPALLGGSWGGYCVLALLALHPGDYCGGISFFGVTDIPAMMESDARRSRELAKIEFAQFGDLADAREMAKLSAISPIEMAESINEPVIAFHNTEDTVVDFSQGASFARRLGSVGGRIDFRAGAGDHEFSPAKEASIYAELAQVIMKWRAD